MKQKTFNRLKSAAWFLLKLNILAIPLYLIFYFGWSVPAYQNVWASALGTSLQSFGYDAVVSGHTIAVKVGQTIHEIDLSWDSTGWKSLYAITALTFATSMWTVRRNLRFLAFAMPLLAFVNFLRIDTTSLFSLATDFKYFDFVHVFLWGGLMTGFVIALWYLLFFKEKVNSR